MKYKIKRQDKHFILEELPDPKFYLDILNEPTPCYGCVHIQKCGTKRLACDAFAIYVNDGRVNWEIPRLPTRRTYTQVMRLGDGNSSLMRRINKKLREGAEA
jgi:hypothetical protein